MKVGIITHYYKSKNVGGLLQAFALCHTISNLGFDAEQICYDARFYNPAQKYKKLVLRIDQVLSRSPQTAIEKLKRRVCPNSERSTEERNQLVKWNCAFQNFEEKIPHSNTVYTDITCDTLNDEYDAFVCGSDIIWHPGNVLHTPYYLTFANKDKPTFSYAASMGRLPKTPLERHLFKENVQNIPLIGVREKSTQVYLKETLHKEAHIVLDPTLLMKAEDWIKIENNKSIPEKPYVFCYFLGKSEKSRKSAVKFAKEHGYALAYLPMACGCTLVQDAPYADYGIGLFDVGPEEIISLIHHAEFILTDSFHAVVFSTLFQKKFYAFDRNINTSGLSINSRIDDFLDTYHLGKNHVIMNNGVIDFPDINNVPDEVLKMIEKDRQISMAFIKKGLCGD